MPKVKESTEINADVNMVWSVISDLDKEPEYWWGTKEVKNISKDGSVLNREIVQNFGNNVISQKVIFRPKEEIEIQYLKGVTVGTKLLSLEKLNDDIQRVTVTWDIHFPGIYALISFFVARHVKKGTIEALCRIKHACENVTDVKAKTQL